MRLASFLIVTLLAFFGIIANAAPTKPRTERYILGLSETASKTSIANIQARVNSLGGKVVQTYEVAPVMTVALSKKAASSKIEGVSYIVPEVPSSVAVTGNYIVTFDKSTFKTNHLAKFLNEARSMGATFVRELAAINAMVIYVPTKIDVSVVWSEKPGVVAVERDRMMTISTRGDIGIPELKKVVIGFEQGTKADNYSVRKVYHIIKSGAMPGTIHKGFFENASMMVATVYHETIPFIRKFPGVAYVEEADVMAIPTPRKQYIIGFKADVEVAVMNDAWSAIRSLGAEITHNFFGLMPAIAVTLPEDADINALLQNAGIEYVEEEQIVTIS
ncbi:hypothetical protein BC832DRAFT_301016 [Gaertneriomyces semiglobifer]|nr:hypothetical protein BC832DRAFT_301016 [Gaertneriomyces semiglobifer]